MSMPSVIDIFEIRCFEVSDQMACLDFMTYWILADPVFCRLVMVDPDDPTQTSDWETISVLNSPFTTSFSAEPLEVIYSPSRGSSSLYEDVFLDLPSAAGAAANGTFRRVQLVRPEGLADKAGVQKGDFLKEWSWQGDGQYVAEFLPDTRRFLLDVLTFHQAILAVQEQKSQWSLRTAARAVMRRSRIAVEEYNGDAGRQRLASEIRERWHDDPICTTVPIRVWQRYFFEVWGEDAAAAAEVLRVIPCRGDRTLPSELWATLMETGLWNEVRLSASSWPVAPSSIGEGSEKDTTASPSRRLRRMGVDASSRVKRAVFHAAPEALKRSRRGCNCSMM